MADLPAGAPRKRDPILIACVAVAFLGAAAGLALLGWMAWAATAGWNSLLTIFRMLFLAGA